MSVERDTELLQDYIDLLDEKASRPSPFGKIAACTKIGTLRATLGRLAARHPDPDLERAAAAATLEATSSRWRGIASSFWGSKALIALVVVGGQQLVLWLLFLIAAAYGNFTAAPVKNETGMQWRPAQLGVLFLVFFVFAFFFTTPLFSLALIWGGRFRASWRKTIPALLALLLAAAIFTFLSFRGAENPAYAKSSIHQFTESRLNQGYASYEKWLELNWILKDPQFQADYEKYLRNGPGRWLANRFDTSNPAAWAKAESLEFIGEFVDMHHDQAKFRDWVSDYVERNKIYSAGIDREVDSIVAPTQQRFLSIWQATPFLKDRDVQVHKHYFGAVFDGVRKWGLIYFALLIALYLAIYAAGPALEGGRRAATKFRFESAAGVAARARDRYYGFPELRELAAEPFVDSAQTLLGRVHRSYVRSILVVSVVAFAGWAVWLASQTRVPEPVRTQRALMDRFVIVPTFKERLAQTPDAVAVSYSPGAPGLYGFTDLANREQPRGPYMEFGLDQDGDGVRDASPVPPLESRLAALQERFDDSDWETLKRFKATEALLVNYKQQLDALKAENDALKLRADEIASTIPTAVAAVQGQASAAAAAAQSASARADQLAGEAAALAERTAGLESDAKALDRRAGVLEKSDEETANRIDNVETDLDEKTRELRARTERLGERATDLADRSEQIASLQRTAYQYLLDQIRGDITRFERQSQSRVYRLFNKKEARARLADLRQRIHEVRAMLQSSSAPEAADLFAELTSLQNQVATLQARFE